MSSQELTVQNSFQDLSGHSLTAKHVADFNHLFDFFAGTFVDAKSLH